MTHRRQTERLTFLLHLPQGGVQQGPLPLPPPPALCARLRACLSPAAPPHFQVPGLASGPLASSQLFCPRLCFILPQIPPDPQWSPQPVLCSAQDPLPTGSGWPPLLVLPGLLVGRPRAAIPPSPQPACVFNYLVADCREEGCEGETSVTRESWITASCTPAPAPLRGGGGNPGLCPDLLAHRWTLHH